LGAVSGLGISFFLTPYIVETLGKEAYGFYPLANNFVLYTGILTTALNSMSGRYITISLEKQEVKEVNVYFNSVFFGNLLFALLFLCLSFLFCVFIDQILDIPSQLLPDVRLLFACIFFSMIIGLASSVFSVSAFALNRFDILAFNNIISNIIKLILTIGLFYFLKPHIYYLGIVVALTAVYYFFISYRNTRKLLPIINISRDFFSWNALSLLMGAGIWNSIMALSMVINSQLDLLIANKFFTASGMGVLSLTKFVPNSTQLLLSIVVPIFLPDMLKAYANQDIDRLKTNLDFSFKAVFFVVLIPLAIFFVYGEDFFKLWLPGEDHHTLYLLSLITLAPLVVHATIETVYHIFVITNKLKIASFWGIFISVSNLVLALAMCRYSNLGIYSIPLAALVTGVLSHLIFTPLYASYCLQESNWYFLLKIGKGLLGFVILVGTAFLWKVTVPIDSDTWLAFIFNTVIVLVITSMIALFLNFDKKTIIYFINKLKKEQRS
jgi:O-antigen/teichoic acid export membrane protein